VPRTRSVADELVESPASLEETVAVTDNEASDTNVSGLSVADEDPCNEIVVVELPVSGPSVRPADAVIVSVEDDDPKSGASVAL
jgi:hypothetical protein